MKFLRHLASYILKEEISNTVIGNIYGEVIPVLISLSATT
jgi:hypothetical protein